jgi:hypothetical protein
MKRIKLETEVQIRVRFTETCCMTTWHPFTGTTAFAVAA